MPRYQMIFATQHGEKSFAVAIDDDEALEQVAPDLLLDLRESGYLLKGEGTGEVVFRHEGKELDPSLTLPVQGVRSNDIIRVGIRVALLQFRRDGELYDVTQRVELREGDDLLIGNTFLRFHIRSQQKVLNQNTTFIERVRQGRSFQQTVYYMALVGALGGLACWVMRSLLEGAGWLPQKAYLDSVNYALLGTFVGGLSIGFNDHWLGDRVNGRRVVVGIFTGAVAGAIGGALAWLIAAQTEGRLSPLAWMLTGALLGFAISLRWLNVNRLRILHGLLGGLFGSLLGGLAHSLQGTPIFQGAGFMLTFFQALAFMLTGAGITLGINLAPILLRHGVLEFLNSRELAVTKKYGQSRKQWELTAGGKYLIGNQSALHAHSLLGPEVQIYLPDPLVAERHAILTVIEKQYFVEPHPELLGFRRANTRASVGRG